MKNAAIIVDGMIKNETIVRAMDNISLANELIDKIWGKLDIDSYEAALIVGAVTRLRKIEIKPTQPEDNGYLYKPVGGVNES
jgi:hypothetical protein